jgi:hypothetical protein
VDQDKYLIDASGVPLAQGDKLLGISLPKNSLPGFVFSPPVSPTLAARCGHPDRQPDTLLARTETSLTEKITQVAMDFLMSARSCNRNLTS